MVGHGGSSAGSYLADPTSPIPSNCASVVATSTLRRVKQPKAKPVTQNIRTKYDSLILQPHIKHALHDRLDNSRVFVHCQTVTCQYLPHAEHSHILHAVHHDWELERFYGFAGTGSDCIWFKHILFVTEHEKGLGSAKMPVFLYCYPDCASCPANLFEWARQFGAIWAAIKKYSLNMYSSSFMILLAKTCKILQL